MAELASLIKLPGRQSEQSDEELQKLFSNRANVKRELSGLRRERHELLDKLKEQEGAIIRIREQLESLERLLANPLAAANAMVYFQLRHLWRVGAQRVEQFSKELRAQRERKERAKLQEAALEKRKHRLDILNDKLQSLLIKDRDGHRVFANDAYLKFRGGTLEQMLGKRDEDLFPPQRLSLPAFWISVAPWPPGWPPNRAHGRTWWRSLHWEPVIATWVASRVRR